VKISEVTAKINTRQCIMQSVHRMHSRFKSGDFVFMQDSAVDLQDECY